MLLLTAGFELELGRGRRRREKEVLRQDQGTLGPGPAALRIRKAKCTPGQEAVEEYVCAGGGGGDIPS